MLKVGKTKFMTVVLFCGQLLVNLMLIAYRVDFSYTQMSVLAITETVIDIIVLKTICSFPAVSIPNIFAFFSLMFHCGQLIKEGFNIEGTVPLPFEYYGDAMTIQKSFTFFLLSQTVYFIAVGISCGKLQKEKKVNQRQADVSVYGKILVLIGVIPRLYIDILSLVGARANGYEGVYSIYFPQAIQSIAFFFDAGLFFLLYAQTDRRKQKFYLVAVIVYKCIMMSTGARQDKVAFLLVWLYVYFFIINKITVKKLALLVVVCIAGFMFISAIGTIRVNDTVSLSQTLSLLQSGTMNNVIGGALGEFGSAFDTLEVAIKYTPSEIPFGWGKSYVAGLLSIIPLLVNQIPSLAKAVMFVNQLPKHVTFALGGSFLGELFYNFSWFGIIGSSVVGAFITKLHNGIVDDSSCDIFYKAWYSILATAMILFVRGYFTDMMQKLVWTYIAIYIIRMYLAKRETGKDIK
ncbi:O-antigen polysaccharide polymerase Wzy [Faecalibacterium prausnitzii]|uniref:O-antigen polysaccharide polymerase Wzy n=1 Tax=Faecalibacterium prausnitzii TaxID=853 RepID=UPI002666A1FC|nr:O-antigen polysaccharide polymerase Wzy [Faecalibacterium prausnitzii]